MHILNEYGKAVWQNKYNKQVFAERSYDWVDRLIIIHEINIYDISCPSMIRTVIDDTRFSTFNLQDWIPITIKQYQKVKSFYSDINK